MENNQAAKKAFARYADRQGRPPRNVEDMLDHRAVIVTMSILESEGKSRCTEAVRFVYFFDPETINKKGEINRRVIRFSSTAHVSIPTAYRWLAEACAMFNAVREALAEKVNAD